MQCTDEKYAITYFHFDYENTQDGSFVMASKTNMELIGVNSTVVRLQYNWSRKILRTENNKPIVFQKSRTYIKFGFEISDALINEIFDVLKNMKKKIWNS